MPTINLSKQKLKRFQVALSETIDYLEKYQDVVDIVNGPTAPQLNQKYDLMDILKTLQSSSENYPNQIMAKIISIHPEDTLSRSPWIVPGLVGYLNWFKPSRIPDYLAAEIDFPLSPRHEPMFFYAVKIRAFTQEVPSHANL